MLEQRIEQVLFASRWLLAPIYLGLSLALVALGIKFFQEVFHVLPAILSTSETDMVLTALALVDISLVASLIIMVMLSGYENFVSKIDVEGAEKKIGWMGKLDSGTLKIKVAASIVAISSIHLLRVHGSAADRQHQAALVRDIPHDFRRLRAAAGLSGQDRVRFASRRGRPLSRRPVLKPTAMPPNPTRSMEQCLYHAGPS